MSNTDKPTQEWIQSAGKDCYHLMARIEQETSQGKMWASQMVRQNFEQVILKHLPAPPAPAVGLSEEEHRNCPAMEMLQKLVARNAINPSQIRFVEQFLKDRGAYPRR